MRTEKLGNIVLEIKTGKTPPTSNSNYFGDEIAWYTPTDLDRNKDLSKSVRGITNLAIIEKKAIVYKPNTLLVGCIGDIGKIGVTKKLSSSNQQITGVLPNDKMINVDYLYYWFKANKSVLQNASTSSIVPILNNKQLSAIRVSFPEKIEDQIRIAAVLSKVETLIKQRKESIDLLDEYLKSAFIKRFIHIEYPLVKLDSITTKITDGEHKKPDYKEEGKPFISVVNISKGFLNFENCKFVSEEDHLKFNKRCNPEFEDIIYTKVGATYGRAVLVNISTPFSLYVSVALIKPDRQKVNPYFLKSAINHPFVKRQADKSIKGAGVPDLHLIEIKSFEIPLPPMQFQVEFADLVKKVEYLKSQYQNSLQEFENLFASLSQKAFKGELDLSKMAVFYEEQYSATDNDRTEPSHFNKLVDFETITVKVKPHKFYGGGVGEHIVAGERLAIQIKEKYRDKHFSFEMLANFIKKDKVYDLDKYFSSEEIKANPKYDELEDLKVFLESAIVNVEMDVMQKEKRNPWLHLNQHFYNAQKENMSLELTKEDFTLIKNRTAEERSGIYFKIVPNEIN